MIAISFANIKEKTFEDTQKKIFQMFSDLYSRYDFLKQSKKLTDSEVDFFLRVQNCSGSVEAALALHHLSDYLSRYYGKRTIILLDEYDTPMQEAYVNGYWDDIVAFTRNLFNSTFKTNSYLERGIMFGILLKPELDAPSPLGSEKPRQADEVGFPAKLEKTSLSSQCQ